ACEKGQPVVGDARIARRVAEYSYLGVRHSEEAVLHIQHTRECVHDPSPGIFTQYAARRFARGTVRTEWVVVAKTRNRSAQFCWRACRCTGPNTGPPARKPAGRPGA